MCLLSRRILVLRLELLTRELDRFVGDIIGFCGHRPEQPGTISSGAVSPRRPLTPQLVTRLINRYLVRS